MTEPIDQATDTSHDVHAGPIRTPKQLVTTVIASFVVPIVVIVLLVNFVDFGSRTGAGSNALDPESIATRIQPVGAVEIRDAAAGAVLRNGEQVFNGQCGGCHAQGLVGAPKFGDEAAWAPRIKTGFDALLNSALKGKGAMPPQGGGEFNDVEVGRGVAYMANKAGAHFSEPQAPAEAASGAASAAK